jgi:hypothetical protein
MKYIQVHPFITLAMNGYPGFGLVSIAWEGMHEKGDIYGAFGYVLTLPTISSPTYPT